MGDTDDKHRIDYDLERVLPLGKRKGAGADEESVEGFTTLDPDTTRRRYGKYIVKLSERRRGMKFKHVLKIADGTLKP